jgi:hypothetical protein
MADWLVASGLHDPMADRRGQYSTEREYRKLLRFEGGIVASCIKRFSSIGMPETLAPKAGDVALVMTPFAIRRGKVVTCATGAICVTDRRLAFLTEDVGLLIVELPIVKAWTL